MTPGPDGRKCTAYLMAGPGGMPLGLGFNDRLGHAFEDAMNFADWYRENEAFLIAQPFTNYVAAAAWKAGQDAGREQAANLLKARADKIASEAERAAKSEPDEVSALRAMAWQLTVAEREIRGA